jgi:hypothetical protein
MYICVYIYIQKYIGIHRIHLHAKMNEYGISSVVLTVCSGLLFLYVGLNFILNKGSISQDPKERKIQYLHLFAGAFHIISALALGWLSYEEPIVWEAPTYTLVSIWQNTTVDGCSKDGRCFVDTKLIRGKNIPVAIFAVLFGIVSGGAHLAAAIFVGPAQLLEYAETGTNWTRWADYTLSASLMICVISCLSGVLDSYVLSTVSLLQAFMLCGAYFIEKDLADAYINSAETRVRGLVGLAISCFFYVPAVWGPPIGAFYQSITNAPGDVPKWINVMIWILFFLFSSFIGIMVYYLVYGGRSTADSVETKKRNMVLQELGYICLSLTSKITLHWVLFTGITSRGGVLFLSEEDVNDPTLHHRTGEDSSKTTRDVLIAAGASIAFGICSYVAFRIYILKEYASNQIQKQGKMYSFIGTKSNTEAFLSSAK